MKNDFSKVKFWNLFIGFVVGFAVSMIIFSALVPSGQDMIVLYHLENGGSANGNLRIDRSASTSIPSSVNHYFKR